MVARLKTAMNNSSLDSECDICWYYLVSPNLSIRREDKCSLFMFSMPAIFINHYPSPFSDLSSALKNLSVFSFLLMKTNPHLLLFLPTLSQHFFQLCCISFDIQDQICLQHSRCTQTMKDCSGILILLFAPHSIHNNSSTLFAFFESY